MVISCDGFCLSLVMILKRGYLFVESTGFPLCQFQMQEVFPQPLEAIKAYLDCNVQEATQEGIFLI